MNDFEKSAFSEIEDQMIADSEKSIDDIKVQFNTDMYIALKMLGKSLEKMRDNALILAAHLEVNNNSVGDDPKKVDPLLKKSIEIGSVGAQLILVRGILLNCLISLDWEPLTSLVKTRGVHTLIHALDMADTVDCDVMHKIDEKFAKSIGAHSVTDFQMELALGRIFERSEITSQLMDATLIELNMNDEDDSK